MSAWPPAEIFAFDARRRAARWRQSRHAKMEMRKERRKESGKDVTVDVFIELHGFDSRDIDN
jgi:hypothetical protein